MGKNFTDEQLAAFLDDEASPALRNRIDEELKSSEDLRQRVQGISDVVAQIRGAFDAQDDDVPPFHLTEEPRQMPRILIFALRPTYIAGFASLMVMIFSALFFLQVNQKTSHPGQTFAALHKNQGFLNQDIWNVSLASEREKFAQLSFYSAQLNIDLTRVMSVRHLSFTWARLVNLDDHMAIQLNFLADSGEEISLYFTKQPNAMTDTPTVDRIGGFEVSTWRTNRLGIALVQPVLDEGDVHSAVLQRQDIVQKFFDIFSLEYGAPGSRFMI